VVTHLRKSKWDLGSVKRYYEQYGCEFIGDLYEGVTKKYEYRCKCGEKHTTTFQQFQRKSNCPQCSFEERRSNIKERILKANKDNCEFCVIDSQGKQVIVDREDFEKVMLGGIWRIDKKGYASRKTGTSGWEYMHKVIMNAGGDVIVDHIDGNPSNNRKSNLRIVNRTQNNMNSKTRTHNTSGYKGVTKSVSSDKYVASIGVNYKRIYLGVYQTPTEAALAYNQAALKYHGEYAKLNKIKEGE
jgi:hypothetical protein